MFTKTIWGVSAGYRFVFTGKPGEKKMAKKVFSDNETAHAYALAQSQAGLNVWYGVAVYLDDNRKTQANVKELRALWLDIDIAKPNCYATLEEALVAVKDFCLKYALPQPTFVCSGYGLHVYFLLTDALPRPEWERLAKALKRLVKAHGILADNGLTADSARLLRLPGTLNYKNPTAPQPVKILGDGVLTTVADLRRALAPYIEEESAKAANDVFLSQMPSLPSDEVKVAHGCAQMRTVKESRGNVSEPLWYAALQVLAYCEEGERLAHEYSNGYAKYSQRETQEKYERAATFPPTLCERFSDVNPDGCNGCPFKGKISTPVQIGQIVTALAAPPVLTVPPTVTPVVSTETIENPYPAPPAGYQVGVQGIWRIEPEDERLLPVCSNPMFVIERRHGRAGAEVEIVWLSALGNEYRAVMPMANLADKRKVAEWLYSNAITGFLDAEQMRQYITAGINALAAKAELTQQYDRFGWEDESFILGKRLLTTVGTVNAALSSRIPTNMLNGYNPAGSSEKWAEATQILNRPGLWVHRFTVLAMLGTPLLKLMNWNGAMLSLAGDSGVGKTTAAYLGMSAYCQYHANEITPQSTDNAIYEQLYLAHNLPLLINESSTISPHKIGDLVYAAVNGQARKTLTRNSELRQISQWANLTVLTSNQHLTSLDDKYLNEAQRYRILEISLNKNEHFLSRAEAKAIYTIIEKNYAVAGEDFLNAVIKHRPAICKMLAEAYERYDDILPTQSRFVGWLLASAEVAGVIASNTDNKLIRFEWKDCITNALAAAKSQAKAISSDGEKVYNIIAEYVNAHNGYFTVNRANNKSAWQDDYSNVKGSIAGRYTHDKEGNVTLSIPLNKLNAFAFEKGVDRQTLEKWAEGQKGKTQSVRLAPLSPPITCLVLNVGDEPKVENK